MEELRFKKAMVAWLESAEGKQCMGGPFRIVQKKSLIIRLKRAFAAGWTAAMENAKDIIKKEPIRQDL